MIQAPGDVQGIQSFWKGSLGMRGLWKEAL